MVGTRRCQTISPKCQTEYSQMMNTICCCFQQQCNFLPHAQLAAVSWPVSAVPTINTITIIIAIFVVFRWLIFGCLLVLLILVFLVSPQGTATRHRSAREDMTSETARNGHASLLLGAFRRNKTYGGVEEQTPTQTPTLPLGGGCKRKSTIFWEVHTAASLESLEQHRQQWYWTQ